MASPSTRLQHSNTPLLQQNALDGVPLCFMLRRLSRPNRARGEVSIKIGRLGRKNALLPGLEVAANK